ncbi:MAG: glycosyltransferase [Muribaculaceae bacterium]|nr:glycosyltransferase [Muribaculaceae bacterium]
MIQLQHISLITWVLLGCGILLALAYLLWQWRRTQRVAQFIASEDGREYAEELPPVSILVDACTETGRLTEFLPAILGQEYPEYEVIVIADGSAEATSKMLSGLRAEYDNLHITFAPSATRGLSRKKLALMIGIKASQYDILLTTCANCHPASPLWLQLMMRNFTATTDVVLGYAHYPYEEDRTKGHRWRLFDSVTQSMQWVVSAIKGKPYRGMSENLAYRKRCFYDNKGFATTMDLQWGEDDVFISQIANGENTRLELDPASHMVIHSELPSYTHRLKKMRRDFTSRLVRRTPSRAQGALSALYYLTLAALVGAAVASLPTILGAAVLPWPSIVAAAVAVVLAIAFVVLAAMLFWRQSRCLDAPALRLTVTPFTLARPVVNALYRLRERNFRDSNYTSIYK